jgi:hypothetical protein
MADKLNNDTNLLNDGAGGVPAKRPDWTYEFAAWLARQPVKPTKAMQIEWIQEFTQKGFTDYRLRQLHKNPEFMHALLKYELSHIERAKDMVLRKLDKYVERFDWAVDTAYQEGDYKTVGQLAPKPLEQTIWKRKDENQAATSVTINISEARLSGIDTDAPVVEFEEIIDDSEEADY